MKTKQSKPFAVGRTVRVLYYIPGGAPTGTAGTVLASVNHGTRRRPAYRYKVACYNEQAAWYEAAWYDADCLEVIL